YGAAKARVFQGAGVQVLNRDDPRSVAMAIPGREVVTFGLDAPRGDAYGVVAAKLVHGTQAILPVDELPIRGAHNVANALAACALVSTMRSSLEGLKTFKGLPHRLELVAVRGGKEWYDDSKGTNVGATAAALRGLGRKVVLILGGEGKGQDFSPLRDPVKDFSIRTFLIGRDAPLIEKALSGLPMERVSGLEEAVKRASTVHADAVLLSP